MNRKPASRKLGAHLSQRLSLALSTRLDAEAEARGVSRGVVVRDALNEHFARGREAVSVTVPMATLQALDASVTAGTAENRKGGKNTDRPAPGTVEYDHKTSPKKADPYRTPDHKVAPTLEAPPDVTEIDQGVVDLLFTPAPKGKKL